MLSLQSSLCIGLCPELLYNRYSVGNSVFLVVKTCSKAILAHRVGHDKSPCFLQLAFLRLVGSDYPLLILPYVDGAKNMDCAFCYGTL
jgi:hypothetical protein